MRLLIIFFPHPPPTSLPFRAKHFLSAVFPKPSNLTRTSLWMEEEEENKNNVPAVNTV